MAGNSQPRHSSPRNYEESGVPSTLWSSMSLENIILNLTKKYCLLDSTGNQHGSTADLQDSTSWFGTKEDLRFYDHNNHNSGSYHQSAILNSNMNFHEQNLVEDNAVSVEQSYGLTTQESCKPLSISQPNSGSIPLLTTTQSATEASELSDKWLSGISRKYGSVPNLKVSRYETAFGPDNRTVTRVFYQNGMTTDYGHDDEESSFLQRRNRTDRANSAVCLSDGDTQPKKDSCFTKKTVARSKSFVDVNKCKKNISVEAASLQPRNVAARSSSFNGNNSSFRQQRHNHSSPGNHSRLEYNAGNRPCYSFRHSENHPACQQTSVDCDHIEAAPSSQNTSTSRIQPASASQDKHPQEIQTSASYVDNVSLSQCQSHPSQSRTSGVSTSSFSIVNVDVPFSPTKQPAGYCGFECNHGAYSVEHIPSHEAAGSPSSLPTHKKQLCDLVPLKDDTGSRYGQGDGSFHEKQETEYCVVLDASKKKSVPGWTNIVSQYTSQSCINLTSLHKASSSCIGVHVPCSGEVDDRMTSTPCLSTCEDTTAAKEGFTSCLSLSHITPLYSSNSHIHRTSNRHTFISCKLLYCCSLNMHMHKYFIL